MAELILRFLYVGLFTVGGGLAAVPLMLEAIVAPGYLSESLFYSMLAISESTPGPIGVNLATYIGFERFGVPGGVLASLAVALPCFLISYLVSRVFDRFSGAQLVQTAFTGIRACVTGLIATAAWGVMRLNVFDVGALLSGDLAAFLDVRAFVIFLVLWLLYEKTKKHPCYFILAGAAAGMLLL